MNLPGFTAEESLTRSQENYSLDFVSDYWAPTGASSYRGTVQPAQSDRFVPHDAPRLMPDSSRYRPRPAFCLKPCFRPPWDNRPCRPQLGIWNPVTGHCE